MDMSNTQNKEEDGVVLCAASAYEEKFFLNPDFAKLPEQIRQELQIMCVLYTADVGGVIELKFDETGNLLFNVTSEEDDCFFDEIGSVLKIKQIQMDKRELLEELELYYKVVFLKQNAEDLLASVKVNTEE